MSKPLLLTVIVGLIAFIGLIAFTVSGSGV
jgi:hypothetical protein